MTPDARAELAARLEEAVRGVPGVRNVYRSGSLISNLLRTGAALLGALDDDRPIVSVLAGQGGVVIEASIGIDFGSPASVVLHAAYAAVDAVLRDAGQDRESITLTVVYVQSREAA